MQLRGRENHYKQKAMHQSQLCDALDLMSPNAHREARKSIISLSTLLLQVTYPEPYITQTSLMGVEFARKAYRSEAAIADRCDALAHMLTIQAYFFYKSNRYLEAPEVSEEAVVRWRALFHYRELHYPMFAVALLLRRLTLDALVAKQNPVFSRRKTMRLELESCRLQQELKDIDPFDIFTKEKQVFMYRRVLTRTHDSLCESVDAVVRIFSCNRTRLQSWRPRMRRGDALSF